MDNKDMEKKKLGYYVNSFYTSIVSISVVKTEPDREPDCPDPSPFGTPRELPCTRIGQKPEKSDKTGKIG